MRGSFLMKTAESNFLAPALLWLMVARGAQVAESAPEGSRSPAADPRRSSLLPAPKRRQEGPLWSAAQGGFPWREVKNTSDHPAQEASAPAHPSGPPVEVPRVLGVLEMSFQISALALVFAAFCGWGVLLPFCQSQKLQIRGKAWKWLSIYSNGLACLASILAIVALILWSYDQGFPAIFIIPIIILLHVVLVTALVVVTIVFQLNVLHQVTDGAAQRMLDLTTPGGAILVAVVSGVLIKCIRRLQEEEHVEPVGLTAVVAGASGMCIFPAIVIVVAHCMDMQKRSEEERISQRKKWREAVQQEKIILP